MVCKKVLFILLCLSVSLNVSSQSLPGLKKVKIGVVLPLKEKTQRGAKMVEFYQGVLMAVDSMRHVGLSVDVKALHSGTTAHEMDLLLASNSLADRDVVFGPLDNAQQPGLADYCDIHGIRLVVPFSTQQKQVSLYPRHYMASAPRSVVQREALWFLQNHFKECNFIVVDCNEKNDEGTDFVELLRSQMAQNAIYVRQMNVNGDDIAFNQAFNSQRTNMLVLNSSSRKALNQLLPRLQDYKKAYPDVKICLLGYPSWQTYTNQLLNDFYVMDTYVFSSFFRNPLATRNESFDRQFLHWFHQPMGATFPRYGQMGFDLAFFFLRGLSIYGDNLETNLSNLPVRPYQHPFYFVRQGNEGGFMNEFVQLIHYSPNQTIELVTRNR